MWKYKIKLFISLLMFMLLLSGCSGKKISEANVRDAITQEMRAYFLEEFAQVDPEEHVLTVNSVSIESTAEEQGGQMVYAAISMGDDDLSVVAYYKMLFRNNNGNWRLDESSEYKASDIKVKSKPNELRVREWYEKKYGILTIEDQKEENGCYQFKYLARDEHTYLTITQELTVAVEMAVQGKTIFWTGDNVEEGNATYLWNAEGKWCEYPNSNPQTYGKGSFFSDSRYVYTVKKQGNDYAYTIDRYTCKPGGHEVYDKSHLGIAKIYEDGTKSYISCPNEFTSCSLEIHADEIVVVGFGVYDSNLYEE